MWLWFHSYFQISILSPSPFESSHVQNPCWLMIVCRVIQQQATTRQTEYDHHLWTGNPWSHLKPATCGDTRSYIETCERFGKLADKVAACNESNVQTAAKFSLVNAVVSLFCLGRWVPISGLPSKVLGSLGKSLFWVLKSLRKIHPFIFPLWVVKSLENPKFRCSSFLRRSSLDENFSKGSV